MIEQQPRAQKRHEQILDAALRVFAKKGYRDSAVDDIALESSTSKGGVYFHFPGKQAIFLALMDRTAERLRGKIESAMRGQTEPVARADAALLAVLRTFAGAAFLGAVTDAMLLGHWYLVQPGLSREPIQELVRYALWLTPIEVLLMLVSPGMIDVLNGTIDDGWGGLIGWMWVVAAISTLGLLLASRAALREPYYSAVMATTGLLYLAILTAFGTDVMARAAFAP
jgi:AcrR family transcriptional regulator